MRESEEATEGAGHSGGSKVFSLGPGECEESLGLPARMEQQGGALCSSSMEFMTSKGGKWC